MKLAGVIGSFSVSIALFVLSYLTRYDGYGDAVWNGWIHTSHNWSIYDHV